VKSSSRDEGEAMDPAYQIVNEISGASFQNRDSFDMHLDDSKRNSAKKSQNGPREDLDDSPQNSGKKSPLVHREFSGEINYTIPTQVSGVREDNSLGNNAICGGAFRLEDGKFLQAKYSLGIRQY
jgi:hypothetical protein